LFANSYYIHILALKDKTTEHYLHILVRRIKCLLLTLIIQYTKTSRWGNSILLLDFGKVIKEQLNASLVSANLHILINKLQKWVIQKQRAKLISIENKNLN
jgi:hypothetical protein